MSSFKKIHAISLKYKNSKKINAVKKFFKTGPGQYGEGDEFYGINTPTIRKLAVQFKDLHLIEIAKLFESKIHEERAIGIIILMNQYKNAIKTEDLSLQKKLYKKYYNLRERVNNWDLVDISAPHLSGHYYFHHNDKDLLKLMNSKNLWDRRIAILSMFYFIRQEQFEIPIKIITARLNDKEDLMHKACGWMLREIGKRNSKILKNFLNKHAANMPRTALRYSLEKFGPEEKTKYMSQVSK